MYKIIMKLINKITILEKKSKFVAYYYEINEIEEFNLIRKELIKEHKHAAHIPYALKINNIYRKSDDKEPNNTAGTPILNIIIKNDLNNCAILVVRYFGGVKLGAGLLLRTFSKAARECIKKAN